MNNSIYKVNHLVDNKIKSIYVFYGKKVELDKKEKKEKKKEILFKDIFTSQEIENINQNNINVEFLDKSIYIDDSIGVIKTKILEIFQKKESFDEIYLFCEKIEKINPILFFNNITQNNRIELNLLRLQQALTNILYFENGQKIEFPQDKNVYELEDIVALKLGEKKCIVNKVLGQKFFIIENEYPFIVNPFKVKKIDSFFEKNAKKSITTLNSHLLLNTGEIIGNNLYLCFAENTLEYLTEVQKDISQENIIKIYFPFLFIKNIESLDKLNENKQFLIDNNKKILNENSKNYFDTIDMFYNIYYKRKTNLNYISSGIKKFKIIIKPKFRVLLPLEIIFKLIHASENNPFIKYNPSSRQENIFRLLVDGISTDGRKIPFLKKAIIFKLIKTIGKTKSVTIFIETKLKDKEKKINLLCEFQENGFITIESEIDSDETGLFSINDIEELIKNNINPIIDELNNYFEQSGLKIDLFENLNQENIEINNIIYETNIAITKKINIDSIMGCLSSVFNNESSAFKKNIQLRFKRVSNFNKVSSKEAFILEKRNDGNNAEEIVEALLENFKGELNRKEAEELIKKVANEIQVEKSGFKKTDIKIKNNPGFKTNLFLDSKNSSVKITMENINDIYYLETIPIYLDTFIRLTQNKKSTDYPFKEIEILCNSLKNEKMEDILPKWIPDIISVSESEISKKEIPILEEDNESIHYDKNSDKDSESESDKNKNALGLFFGDDDDEEEEEEDEEEEEQVKQIKKIGGQSSSSEITNSSSDKDTSEKDPNVFQNIDGMSLRNYFQNEIEKKDKALIIKQPIGNFSIYSKVCQSATKRQPVIVTDEQLAKINSEHKNFLRQEDVIRYGSDKNKQFNYLCPRYWCLKTNTLIDSSELREVEEKGKKILVHPTCGKILPDDADTILPGHYVYEFYKPTKTNPDYKRYPNFQVDKHPDGHCLPCCFDKWKTEARINAKKKCSEKKGVGEGEGQAEGQGERVGEGEEDLEEKKEDIVEKKSKKELEDEYVKGPDKFPLPPGRWGYLPPSIQTMLQEVNADCTISKTNTNLKSDHPCLLRHGIEINKKQSFIACISDAIFFAKKIKDKSNTSEILETDKISKILSIKEMRKRIINSLTIDSFITFQNGNLVTDFYDINRKVDINKYNQSKLYSKLDFDKEVDILFYTKIISAFENFISFLDDDDSIINEIYLWDIISQPNNYLFPSGVNLIILEIANNDITNNVNILCPTNHYSKEFYDSRKPTLLIIKEDEFYEPIYSLTISGNKNSITKIFSEFDPRLSKTIRAVLNDIIKPLYKAICKPLESLPTIVTLKRPISLYDLIEKLDKYKYLILKTVMNFKNKIIGVVAKSPSLKTGFIPCYPSSLEENVKKSVDYVLMTDNNIWRPYNETFVFLMELVKKSKKKNSSTNEIPCKPEFKVVEDEMVVGILTETNQFIQISEPILETKIYSDYNLPSFKNSNYIIQPKTVPMIQSDIYITTTNLNNVDTERVDYINKIKMESQFYNVFRNTIKIVLNQYENIKKREEIEKEIKKEYILYNQKIKKIDNLLRELIKDQVQFIGDKNYYKILGNLTTCILKDKQKCDNYPNLCVFSSTNKCKLILPERNLISNKLNEFLYFHKIADEFIRYSSIRSFMFQPNSYLSFGNLGYNLKDNEIIIVQSLLTQEYFENLVPIVKNKYVTSNSYDEAEPLLSQMYENKVLKDSIKTGFSKDILKEDCLEITKSKIVSNIWSKCFPSTYFEVKYNKNIACTFQIMIDLLNRKTNEIYSINKIKNDLFDEYKKFSPSNLDKIIDILILEGKKTIGEEVKSGRISFINFIYDENYFLTPFDLWILLNKYRIPCFFISSQFIFQTDYKKHIFLAYSEDNYSIDDNQIKEFIFIMIPALKPQSIPGYKYIENNYNDSNISLENLSSHCMEKIYEATRDKISIDQYLENFIITSSTKYKKKKPMLIIESDDEQEKENEK
jgi:hypothetical protein